MIEREYSLALFELADPKCDDIKEQLNAFIKLFNENNLEAYFESPRITKEEKKDILRKSLNIFEPLLIDFLCVLVDNSRFNIIKEIEKDFNELIYEKKGIVHVIVETPSSLNDQQKKELSSFLMERLHKEILLEETINQEVIGGIRVLYNGECIDYTFRNVMNKMQSIL